jgi:diguanylate cyclase
MTTANDGLTGLPNRSVLDHVLKQAIGQEHPVALVLLDIDYFDEVNTKFGYPAGDQLLQGLAALLTAEAPDDVYRISGDEFAVVLRGTSLEQAFLRAEALRTAIQIADIVRLPDHRAVSVTIGVAQYPRDASDLRRLWSAADAALAAAKEAGRNQVALPPTEEMIMKTCYYPASSVRKLKALAERLRRKESHLLREALDDVLRKYDVPTASEVVRSGTA